MSICDSVLFAPGNDAPPLRRLRKGHGNAEAPIHRRLHVFSRGSLQKLGLGLASQGLQRTVEVFNDSTFRFRNHSFEGQEMVLGLWSVLVAFETSDDFKHCTCLSLGLRPSLQNLVPLPPRTNPARRRAPRHFLARLI